MILLRILGIRYLETDVHYMIYGFQSIVSKHDPLAAPVSNVPQICRFLFNFFSTFILYSLHYYESGAP